MGIIGAYIGDNMKTLNDNGEVILKGHFERIAPAKLYEIILAIRLNRRDAFDHQVKTDMIELMKPDELEDPGRL